jgi:glycosyltransferase involved in cell wall biosynthesis
VTSRPDVLLVADVESVHVRRLASGLTAAGIRVEVAGFAGDPIAGVPIHRLGSMSPDRDVRYPFAVPALAKILRQRRPAIVHAHYVSSFGLLAAVATRLAFPRGGASALVQTAWGTDLLVTARASSVRRVMASAALRAARLITGDSDDLEHEARSLAPRVPYIRFVFGPPADLFTAARDPQPLFVSSRRLDDDMRVELVVRGFMAARRTDERLDKWRLVVAGDGARAESIRTEAAGDPAVNVVGRLDQTQLHTLLLEASVAVSVPRSDATSAALLEAMAAGVQPVVNDLPANRQWVHDGLGVILSRDPSPSEVAAGMIAAASRPVSSRVLRARVRPTCWEDELRTLVGHYQRLSGAA